MTARRADIVVVGAGAAGLSAALEAAAAGAVVTVVDCAARLGGTAAGAGGGTFAVDTPLQRRLGVRDSRERAFEDWLAWGGPSADSGWARRYVDESVSAVIGWLEALGVTWDGLHRFEGNRTPRWHAPRGGGRAVVAALGRATRGCPDICWLFGHRMTELVVAGGAVVGVRLEGPNGPAELAASRVLVATGGFCSDVELVRRHAAVPEDARILLGGGGNARGDGHRVLEAIGARLVNLGAVWMYPHATPDPDDPTGLRGLVLRGLDGDIWVNGLGRRFHDESLRGGASGTPALLGVAEARCWSVIDAAIARRVVVSDPRYQRGGAPARDRVERLLATSESVCRGATIEELARDAGIDSAGLAETMRAHNDARSRRGGVDSEFGRSLTGVAPLARPPFYAIELRPLARKSLGGVETDADCRVLATSGRPIEGLFAAGEVAGMAGGRINGVAALEGTMLGPSLYSGRIAGRAMAM